MTSVALLAAHVYDARVVQGQSTGASRGGSQQRPQSVSAVPGCYYGETRFVGDLAAGVSNVSTLSPIVYPAQGRVGYGDLAVWVGAVRGTDTLVTSATSSSAQLEFYPSVCGVGADVSPRAREAFMRRFPCPVWCPPPGDSAVSDFDIHVEYADTLTDPDIIASNPYDGRKHRPLGVEIRQTSYSWMSGSAANFVIVQYNLSNTGVPRTTSEQLEQGYLRDVFIGIWGGVFAAYDYDVSSGNDDQIQFIGVAASPILPQIQEDFNCVWMADNNGDPAAGGFRRTSVPDVVGVAILQPPDERTGVSFNWWVGSPTYGSWGPVRRGSKVEFIRGELGEPYGDRVSYQMMSNFEIDYPPYEAALNHEGQGWLPPPRDPVEAENIADGSYLHYLFSIGPFDLPPDSSVTFTIAIVGGKDFHTDPNNFRDFFDPYYPALYRSRLDLTDLLRNVQWAKWTYDNPGIDTDGDGYAGEWFLRGGDTVYYRGDGVPDIRAALPPRTPLLEFHTRAGRIAIRWNGYRTETEDDVFTQRPDFEGYRIYVSRTAREDEWSFLTQRDLVNYARFTWNAARDRWDMKDPPYSLDSLKRLYDTLTLRQYGYPFHPDSFKVPLVEEALLETHWDPALPDRVDSIYRYFAPYEANNTPDDIGLAMAADAGADVAGVIRKLYPNSSPTDTAYRDDGTPYLPYWEYEYVLKDIQLAEPVFISLTAFDHGDPASGLEPLESAKSITSQEVWPINSAEVVKTERPKPGVYPNPYRVIDSYYDQGWENRQGLEPDRERARQVTFYNVPDTCTVSIWTLDGDLVKRLEHASDPGSSEATVVRWNLITRNTQAVKTGLYIWSVESRFGTDVGKLVILK